MYEPLIGLNEMTPQSKAYYAVVAVGQRRGGRKPEQVTDHMPNQSGNNPH